MTENRKTNTMPLESNRNSLDENSVDSIGFLVSERPIAIYGVRLREGTLEFIKHFNADYWAHQVKLATSIPAENVPHEHVASVRLALSHAAEHLFALIFAFLQAPFCPDLWLYQYKPSDLPEMVKKVNNGGHVLTQFGLNETSWKAITKTLWPWLAEEQYDTTNHLLGTLADYFIAPHRRDVRFPSESLQAEGLSACSWWLSQGPATPPDPR